MFQGSIRLSCRLLQSAQWSLGKLLFLIVSSCRTRTSSIASQGAYTPHRTDIMLSLW